MHTPRTSSITVSGHPRTERRPWLGWLCAAALFCPHTGHAQGIRFDVPPQSLGTALDSLAKEAGLQILYPPEAVEGLRTRGVQGEYTPQEAIKRLLDGTGLHYQFLKDNTVTVSEDTSSVKEAKPEEDVTLPEMIVTASPTDATSYNVFDATTATKTDTPIMETPVSIQVVPQQVIRDQQAIRLEDAVKNVSGVQRGWSYGDLEQNFIIRGFFADRGYFRNGVRMGNPAAPAESANLERVEVLKGPAGILYGRIEPGGLINAITKRPLLEPYYSLQQQFGSYDLYRTTLDATGPLTADRSLAYRFNLAYQNSDSFRDFVFDDHVYVAPALTWRPSEATEFNLELEYFDREMRNDAPGIPAIGNKPAPITISRWLGEPDNKGVDDRHLAVYFNWSHRFNDSWTLRNGVVTNLNERFLENVVTNSLRADNRTLDRAIFAQDPVETENYTAYLDLTGNMHFWGMDHTLLVGGDYYLRPTETRIFFTSDPALIGPIDIFAPVYGNVNFPLVRSLIANAPFFSSGDDEWFGIYFQDQITFWDKLHILGGGRYDWAST